MDRDDERCAELGELRARVRELEVELKARDEFIIEAAHELRNPVSPLFLHVHRLLGAARRAEHGTLSAPWLVGQLELFSKRLARFTTALNRILDVSRLQQQGVVELLLAQVDLSEVVGEVLANFERELAASQSTLTFDTSGAVLGLWDRMRLEQIISNLVSNAIRYGNSSPISVSVERVDEQAVLRVSDRGVGIAEADQTRIFGRFERADTANRSGFGVGLWIVRELCEAMGGRVELLSSAGAGSTFTVTLPALRTGSE